MWILPATTVLLLLLQIASARSTRLDPDAISGAGVVMPVLVATFISFYLGLALSAITLRSPALEALTAGLIDDEGRARDAVAAGFVGVAAITLTTAALVAIHLRATDLLNQSLWTGLVRLWLGNLVLLGLGLGLGSWLPALPAWGVALTTQFILPSLWVQYVSGTASLPVAVAGLVLRATVGQIWFLVPIGVFNRVDVHVLFEMAIAALYAASCLYLGVEALRMRMGRLRRRGC
jgi:hypothetical protein